VYQSNNWNTQVLGTVQDYAGVKDSYPEKGRFFTKGEDTRRAKVAIIGVSVAKELFGNVDPIGKWIRINRISFNVIGVLPEKGMSGFQNRDDQIIIPINTAMYRLLGKDHIDYFEVQVTDTDLMTQVEEEVKNVIVKNHRLPDTAKDNIDVFNMAEMQAAATAMVTTLSYLLGSIAAVSLLVGGIGIMNIMLVMVMERTHEIGLRKALGAERRDIMVQFLVEAVLICLVGGSLASD